MLLEYFQPVTVDLMMLILNFVRDKEQRHLVWCVCGLQFVDSRVQTRYTTVYMSRSCRLFNRLDKWLREHQVPKWSLG